MMNILFVHIKDIIENWDTLFFKPAPTLTICVFRVFAGLLMVIESLQWLFYFRKWIDTSGYLNYALFEKYVQPVRFSLLSYLPESNASVIFTIAMQLLSALLLMLGIAP